MPANVWLLNLIVLAVLLEADLGRRKIGWFRLLRPLITATAVIAVFMSSIATSGHDLALEGVGVIAGVLLGLAAHLFMSVGFDPAKGKNGRAVSWAGFGYAVFWALVFAARLVFVYGTEHWFARSLGQFLVAHQLSATGLTDALLFMAVAMALARSTLLAVRARAATRHTTHTRGYSAGALDHNGAARQPGI
jgi:hypothetical protein